MLLNHWWKIHKWLAVALAMPRMLRELESKPESGFLGWDPMGFGTMVQYWASVEQLHAYAKDRDGEHFPAWVDFNRRVRRSGEVGVWHEIYPVGRESIQTLYLNMAPRGLGREASRASEGVTPPVFARGGLMPWRVG